VLVLRFEDLLAAPRKGFSRIVAFIGLDVSSALVRKAAENTRFERLSAREAREGFAERSPHQKRFFRKGRAGSWRAILSPVQRAAIEAAHGDQMARFGYLSEEEG
jgi:hypothetical protein